MKGIIKDKCIVCWSLDTKTIFYNLAGYEKWTFFDIYECSKCKSSFIKRKISTIQFMIKYI